MNARDELEDGTASASSARTPSLPNGPQLRWRTAVGAIFAGLSLVSIARPLMIGWDNALYLQAGEEILRGHVPFVDFVDANPPLIMFLHVPPAILRRMLHLPAGVAFNLWVTLVCAISTVAFDWLLRAVKPEVPPDQRAPLVFAFATTNPIAMWLSEYGQREHFVMLALTLFLVLRCSDRDERAVPRSVAVVVGFFAGLALSVKPYFIPALVLIELWRALRQHSWRRKLFDAEVVGIAVALASYALLFAVLPGMRREYFGFYLPIFARGYSVYNGSLTSILLRREHLFLAGPALLLLIPLLRKQSHWLARPIALFAVGTELAYGIQMKGWHYQLLPLVCLAPLVSATAFYRWRWQATFATVAVVFLVGVSPQENQYTNGLRRDLIDYIQQHSGPQDSVLLLSTGVPGPYPTLVLSNRLPGSRYVWMPFLPMLYKGRLQEKAPYRPWDEAPPDERRIFDNLATDVSNRKPSLIFIQCFPGQASGQLVISDWLRRSGFIARALRAYERVSTVGEFEVWHLREGRDRSG